MPHVGVVGLSVAVAVAVVVVSIVVVSLAGSGVWRDLSADVLVSVILGVDVGASVPPVSGAGVVVLSEDGKEQR